MLYYFLWQRLEKVNLVSNQTPKSLKISTLSILCVMLPSVEVKVNDRSVFLPHFWMLSVGSHLLDHVISYQGLIGVICNQ